MVKRNAGQPEQNQEGKGNREIPAEDPEESEEDTDEGGEDEGEEPDPRLSLPERIRQAMLQHDRNEKVFVAVGRKLKDEPRPTREFSFHIEEDRFHLVPDEIARRCVASGPGVVDFVVQFRTPKGHFIGQQSLSIGGTFVPPKRDVLTPGAGPLPASEPPREDHAEREPVRDARDEELETLRERLDEQDARLQRLRRKRVAKRDRIERKREQRELVAPLLSQIDGLSARLETFAKANLAPPPAPPKDPTEEAKKIIALMREDESGSSKAINALRKDLEDMRSATVQNTFKSELRDRDREIEKLAAKLEALEKHEEKPKKDDFASAILEMRKLEAAFNAGRPAGERSAAFGRLFDRLERKIEGPLGEKLETKILDGLDAFLGTKKPAEKTPVAPPSSGSSATASGGEPAPAAPAPEDAKAFAAWISDQIKAGFVAFDKPDQIREPLAKWPTLLPRFANAPTRAELVTLLVDVLGYPRDTIEAQVDEQKWPLLAMLLETLRKTIAAARGSAPAPTPATTTAAGDAQPAPTPPAAQAEAARREFGAWLLKHLQGGCVDLVKPTVVHSALERWPDHVKGLASVEDRKTFLDFTERLGFERVALESSIPAQLWVQLAPALGFHAQVVGEKVGRKFAGEKMIPPPPEYKPLAPAGSAPPAPPAPPAPGSNGTAAT